MVSQIEINVANFIANLFSSSINFITIILCFLTIFEISSASVILLCTGELFLVFVLGNLLGNIKGSHAYFGLARGRLTAI
jgi:hypothetical protein